MKVSFTLPSYPFGMTFLSLFGEASFSLPGRLVGTKGAQKAPKMEPNWNPKRAWRHFVGSAKTIVFIDRRHLGRSRGGSGTQLFPACVSRPSLEGSWGAFFWILGYFGYPFGLLGAPSWTQNGDFFQGLIFSHFKFNFRRGRRQGQGSRHLQNLQK